MAYIKPDKEHIEIAIANGWSKESAERGYEIFDFDCLGLYEVEAIVDCYDIEDIDDEACAYEAERTGYCKIIPVNELPDPFVVDGVNKRWFGWIDTPENRKAILDYCKENSAR